MTLVDPTMLQDAATIPLGDLAEVMKLVTIIVAVVFVTVIVLASGVVWAFRKLYVSTVDHLMRERSGEQQSGEAPAQGAGLRPAVLLADVIPPVGASRLARLRWRRRLIYVIAGGAYALTFAVLKIGFVADSTRELLTALTNADILWTAGKVALLPLMACLLVLTFRRLQTTAAGIWTASVIVVFLPMGAVTLSVPALLAGRVEFGDTPWGWVAARVPIGVGLVFGYVLFNAWRARRSRWSWTAQGVHSLWFVFGLFFVLGHLGSREWLKAAIIGAVPFAVMLTVAKLAFGVARRPPMRRLLYLRVFGRRTQTERFYPAVAGDWSNIGPVRLIGAPDVARQTMTAGLFAAFVRRRLRQVFQWTVEDLDVRIADADRSRVDASYAPLEIMCTGDRWKLAVERFARDSDVVVMDVRGFSSQNKGCAWELAHLVNTIPVERVVLCADGSTDRVALEETVASAWASVTPASPNATNPMPFRVFDARAGLDPLAAYLAVVSDMPRASPSPVMRVPAAS